MWFDHQPTAARLLQYLIGPSVLVAAGLVPRIIILVLVTAAVVAVAGEACLSKTLTICTSMAIPPPSTTVADVACLSMTLTISTSAAPPSLLIANLDKASLPATTIERCVAISSNANCHGQ